MDTSIGVIAAFVMTCLTLHHHDHDHDVNVDNDDDDDHLKKCFSNPAYLLCCINLANVHKM